MADSYVEDRIKMTIRKIVCASFGQI